MMETSFKILAVAGVATLTLTAVPAFAGKQTIPSATGATTSLAAVPPAPEAAPGTSGGASTQYGTFVGSITNPADVAALASAPGAVDTEIDGEPAKIVNTTVQGQPVTVVIQGGTASVYR